LQIHLFGKVLDGLKQAGVSGYMVIRNVAGSIGGSEDLDMTMLNIYDCRLCPGKNQTCCGNHSILKFGGTCYISDAMEIAL